MAGQVELGQKLEALAAKVAEAQEAQQAEFGRVAADFQFLKDQLAAGVDTQPAIDSLDASMARLQAVIDASNAQDPLPDNPAPEPTPEA